MRLALISQRYSKFQLAKDQFFKRCPLAVQFTQEKIIEPICYFCVYPSSDIVSTVFVLYTLYTSIYSKEMEIILAKERLRN